VSVGIRHRTVLFYLALATVVLIPGLALRFGLDAAALSALGLGHIRELTTTATALQQALADVEFGNGLRFWLGVGGSAMLGLLLLYPVRKVLANRRGVGSVGGWFHLHILLGIAAPVLILYHSNFSHGSMNANVALWTMLLVAFSGIVGYFVYARVSASFYTSRQQAVTHRDAVLAGIGGSAPLQARKDALAAKFEAFEAELLTPRQGLIASVRARLRLERRRREMAADIASLVADTARQRGDSPAAFQQFRGTIGNHVRAYFGIARAAASQSTREQLWSRWRLLHMPVFLIMVAATILHIVAVWPSADVAEADIAGAQVVAVAPAPVANRVTPVAKAITAPPVRANASLDAKATTATAKSVTVQESDAARPASPANPSGLSIRVVKPQILAMQPAKEAQAKPSSDAVPLTAPVPQLVRRPVRAVAPNAAPAAVTPTPPPQQVAAAPSPAPAQAPAAVAIAELQRRIEPPPMALGANIGRTTGKSGSLDEMFAAFKAKQQAGEFSHSELETGFALTGKHLKADCASCHNAPLPATRQNTEPRACVSCHLKDDNHNGRRPDCAKCHTTNRWKQRIR
jgi:hypothetical protein